MNSWIQTFSGEKVDPLNPDPRTLHIVDIAESLSKQCRFTGHLSRFYSTGRHSINCLKLLRSRNLNHIYGQRELSVILRSGLLHDASEAYLSDIARPVKHSGGMTEYLNAEAKIESAICERFRTTSPKDSLIKFVDNVMLRKEAENLFNRKPLDNWVSLLPEADDDMKLPEDWYISDPVKDCNEFLDLYGQYQY